MLFRPSFCCNCGERVDRSEWRLWTSRRFCELCSTDFTLQELVPKLVLALAAVVSIVGITNYLIGGPGRRPLVITRAADGSNVQTRADASKPANSTQNQDSREVKQNLASVPTTDEHPAPRSLAAVSPREPPERPVQEPGEPIYFCGAETKKGTPCSRKVKGNVRCWQHSGMPAMLPPEKLLVAR
jgi:hypothetical protein